MIKLSGVRRKPFGARKTVGFRENGQPIYKFIGYFETQNEANIALAEYNKNPYDIDATQITTAELYEKWLENYENRGANKISETSIAGLKSAKKHCSEVWNMKYKDVKKRHMQQCVDNCGHGYATQAKIKNLFRHLDKFAIEMEIILVCQSATLSSEPIEDTSRLPFTREEIALLWGNERLLWVDSVLIFLYTGFRLSELLDIKIADIDLEKSTIKGGKKTRAGKNRIVPIHPKILKFVQKNIEQNSTFLLEENGKKLSKTFYYEQWRGIMSALKMAHTPHECRHTLRTFLDNNGANKKCIDMIMGHASKEVGERIYTHKTVEELREAVLLIDY